MMMKWTEWMVIVVLVGWGRIESDNGVVVVVVDRVDVVVCWMMILMLMMIVGGVKVVDRAGAKQCVWVNGRV